MSDRETSRSPKVEDRERSSKRSRDREESPRKRKSYSRSASRDRKVYRDERSSRRRDSRDRDYSRRDRSRSRDGSRSRSRRRSPSYSRSRSRSPAYYGRSYSSLSSGRRHGGNRDNPRPNRCLGVFGLSVHTTEDEVYHIMSKYGPVERVQVVIDAKTGRSRGFAFVYFEATEDAKVAKEQCSGMKIDGKSIRVDFSITERAHTPTPGIYMGRPTYKSDRYDRGYRDDYRSSRYRRSPSPYYRGSRRRDYRSRSRSYSRGRY